MADHNTCVYVLLGSQDAVAQAVREYCWPDDHSFIRGCTFDDNDATGRPHNPCVAKFFIYSLSEKHIAQLARELNASRIWYNNTILYPPQATAP